MQADIKHHDSLPSAGLAEKLVLALAGRIEAGQLSVTLPAGGEHLFRGKHEGPEAHLRVRDPRLFRRMLFGGTLAFAESYMDFDWESPDLTALVELAIRNDDALVAGLDGRRWTRVLPLAAHWLRPNSKRGSRRNIAWHYDLGNDFYALWLDPSMTYSAALFRHPEDTLERGQENKYRRIAELADIRPEHHVLEIGCGWGGFCSWAAREIGCRVTAITISRDQYDFAARRLQAEGLAERVELRLQDYRDLDGSFDRIVSIEMLEAVGEAYWPAYFATLRDRLRTGGRAALQVITIDDRFFEAYRRDVDFIQRYIFPGGLLPSPDRLREQVARAGLKFETAQGFGQDYAKTLSIWRRSFEAAWPDIVDLGFDERFRRMWRYYLSYCEAGFRTGRIDVLQAAVRKA